MRPVRRAVLAALLAGAVTLGWAAPAAGDSNPRVTIGDIKSTGSTYQGVLTFRAKQVVQVDAKSVTATVDGKSVPISVQDTSHLQRTALLLIDTSGSMGSSGMQTVRQATAVYLKEVPSDVKVGVLRFASTSQLVLKPTTNRVAVQNAVDGLTANGNTALYGAVDQATKTLGTSGDRSIVLLSDGADTQSKKPGTDLAADTAALKARGIRVDVVRFNNTDPGAERALAQFAKSGGGSDVLATDTAGVAAAFKASAQALNSQAQFTLAPNASLAGDHDLRITGAAAGSPFSISQRVNFGTAHQSSEPRSTTSAASTPAALTDPSPTTASWSWIPWVGGVVIAVALFMLVYFVLTPSVQSRRERRVATVQSYLAAAGRPKGKAGTQPVRTPRGSRRVRRTSHEQAELDGANHAAHPARRLAPSGR